MLLQDKSDEEDFQRVYRQHIDAVYRVCYGFMKNNADAEDAAQETFLSSCKRAILKTLKIHLMNVHG